ncbi:MAG: hypothetical protein M0036_24110 [Desulfobacteraceae bacterium]|nr:hypothetical protein [Desulfobacteraceae bacterium]
MFRSMCGWILIIGLMALATAAQAQDVPAGRWWHSPQVVQQLQLTDGEVSQLEQAFESSRIKMIQLKTQVEAERFKLQTMIEKHNADDAAIKAQHNSLEAARSALADERFAFMIKTRDIIGNARFQQLVNMAPTGRKGNR